MFLANYADVLTDAPHERHHRRVRWPPTPSRSSSRCKPQDSFHVVDIDDDGMVTGSDAGRATWSMWINGGYFVLRQEIFDYLDEGEDLVMDGCVRAAR